MNHELWNELGNLHYMNGAYQPAIHAYLRSIQMDGGFGRPYANLAMAFAQVGKQTEAIRLYRHSVELLTDEKEKAIARKRLGVLYRQLMENDHALEGHQQTKQAYPLQEEEDMPQVEEGSGFPFSLSMPDVDIDSILEEIKLAEIDEENEPVDVNTKFELAEAEDRMEFEMDAETPFSISMPDVNIEAIIAEASLTEPEDDHDELLELNTELEVAEEEYKIAWFENEFVPPNPTEHIHTNEALQETMLSIQSDWRLAYTDGMTSTEIATQVEDEFKIDEDIFEKFEMIVPIDLQIIASDSGTVASPITEADSAAESVEEPAYENSSAIESMGAAMQNETESQAAEYSQVEYPLVELSEAEMFTLKNDIAKYKYSAQSNPRNYSVWGMLGDAYKAAGMYKDAIKAFQTAISINSTKPSYYYRLGLIYAIEGREDDAVTAFQRVLELDPNYAQAHASLASHYQKIGLGEVAKNHLEKALSTKFEEESEYNLACLEAICGNNERALELLEVALQNKQAYINWAQADPDLDSLRKDHRFHSLLSSYAAGT